MQRFVSCRNGAVARKLVVAFRKCRLFSQAIQELKVQFDGKGLAQSIQDQMLSSIANFLEIMFIASLVLLSVALAFELNIWTVKTEFIWTYFGCTSMTVSLFGVLLVSKMSLEAGKRKSSKISFISFSPENTRVRQEDQQRFSNL